jgi:hypothetical protein
MVATGGVDFAVSGAEGAVSSGIFGNLSGRRLVPSRRTLQNNAAQEAQVRIAFVALLSYYQKLF